MTFRSIALLTITVLGLGVQACSRTAAPDDGPLAALDGDRRVVEPLPGWVDRPPAAAVVAAPPVAGEPVDSGIAVARVSLDLRDAEIRDVLRLLGEVAGLAIVASDDVAGTVTIHLSETPWPEALDAITAMLGLEWRSAGDGIRVATRSRLQQEYEASRALQEAAADSAPLQDDYIRLAFAKAAPLADLLAGGGRGPDGGGGGLLGPRGSVLAEPLTNTIVVRDTAASIAAIRRAVAQLDVPAPQVLIESSIVEASTDLNQRLGIQWGYREDLGGGGSLGGGSGESARSLPFMVDFPAASSATGGSAVDLALGSVTGDWSLDLRLTALAREGKARIVSRPRVLTLNNTPATIKSLTIIRVKLPAANTVVSTGERANTSQSVATEKIETGVILVVTPQVTGDGRIQLDLFAKSSQADFSRAVDGIPTETSREATARVLVEEGQTVVLGGIYTTRREHQEEGVPWLRALPAIGWLFKRDDDADRREDLLVFLTPHLVARGDARVARLPEATLQTAR